MKSLIISIFVLIGLANLSDGQIPSFGGCPDYVPMPKFNMQRFLGRWYEVERYFVVTEIASKCIWAEYEARPDGQIWVNNANTNRFTGVQRIVSGVVKIIPRAKDGRFTVRYNALPVSYDTTLLVLDTDYENFAIVYSCSGLGPIGHTESAWVMTRERIPAGPILQRAYGILDKYQISRTFFFATDQRDCETLPPPQAAYDPTEEPDITNSTVVAEES